MATKTPPNILFIMADDLGYADVSCYGRPDLSTPNIDRMAAKGVRFLQAYANSAVCSATRTALMTGRYQYRLPVGLEEPLAASGVGLPPDSFTGLATGEGSLTNGLRATEGTAAARERPRAVEGSATDDGNGTGGPASDVARGECEP